MNNANLYLMMAGSYFGMSIVYVLLAASHWPR